MMKLADLICGAALLAVFAASHATATRAEDLSSGKTGDVYYESYGGDVRLTADVQLPENASGKLPAIILVHGSGGIGHREATWGYFFRENGYVTMVIDMFGPRNFIAMSGPNVGGYDDVFEAFKVLQTHPNVDPDRVSVMGWSWGGGIALSSAATTKERTNGHVLQSMVSFYPVCGVSAIPFTGNKDAEILLVIGTEDTYSKDWQCKEVVDKGVRDGRKARLIVYKGAYHGFDNDKDITFTHGKFGEQTIKADGWITRQAQKDVLAFLKAVGTSQGISANVGSGSGASGNRKPEGCKDPTFASLFPNICS